MAQGSNLALEPIKVKGLQKWDRLLNPKLT